MKELLRRHLELAESVPDGPAILYQREPYVGVTLTWGDLCTRASELREQLLARDVPKRQVSALVLRDHPDLIPLLLALWQIDCPPVLLDPKWGDRLTANVLSHSTPAFLVDLEQTPTVTRLSASGASDGPDDAVFIGYTSGSTGDPKAIVFSHERLYAGTLGNESASVRLFGRRPERIARSMRMSGSGVINLHHTWAAVMGSCVVVLPELTMSSAPDYWAMLQRFRIDQVFLVPQLIELVSRFAADRDPAAPAPLFFTGSAPLSERTQERFQRRFGLPLFNAYGLSETSSAAFFGHLGADGLATNSVGTPERLEARLRDQSGQVVDGAGVGEIELRGPQVFDGYYRNPHATRQALVDSWLKTGDIGERDPGGNYHLIGRSKDVVMKGGYAIYLTEIEDAAGSHPEVLEVAAVPLLLADRNEDIGCLIRPVTQAGITGPAMQTWLRASLGAQRAPCRVVMVDSPLPRGGQDKLNRPEILDLWDSLPNVPRSYRASWEPASVDK